MRIKALLSICRRVKRQATMGDRLDVRHFGYRTPRYPFSKMVIVEAPLGASSRLTETDAVNISVDGIAVSADISFDPIEPVILVIPLADRSDIRVPGRVLCQSESHCRFVFKFATAEQRTKIEELISGFRKT